jgi:predicted RNA polymerase sigma factor
VDIAHNADKISNYHNIRGLALMDLGRREEAFEDFDKSTALGNTAAEGYKTIKR